MEGEWERGGEGGFTQPCDWFGRDGRNVKRERDREKSNL